MSYITTHFGVHANAPCLAYALVQACLTLLCIPL